MLRRCLTPHGRKCEPGRRKTCGLAVVVRTESRCCDGRTKRCRTVKGAAQSLSRHLHAAIERVREDVEKVEFWADAVAEFTQPVPDYDPGKVNVWLPAEQATALSSQSASDAKSGPDVTSDSAMTDCAADNHENGDASDKRRSRPSR